MEEQKTMPWGDLPEGWQIASTQAEPAKDREHWQAWRLQRSHKAEQWESVSGPLWVSARAADKDGEGSSILLEWIGIDGDRHSKTVPAKALHDKNATIIQDLATANLYIVKGKEASVISYLNDARLSARSLRASARTGWTHDKKGNLAYVTTSGVIPDSLEVVYTGGQKSDYASKGSLNDWQQQVASRIEQYPYLLFATAMAFSVPLLKLVSIETCGVHFYETSSRGKTTSAQVAASVWGCGSDPATDPDGTFIKRWNATANALEGICSSRSDSLLALDELGTFSGKDLANVIYNICGGREKSRMTPGSDLKAGKAWHLAFISTGEKSIATMCAETAKIDGNIKAGALVRVLDIPLPPEGMFNGAKNGKDIADGIKKACGSSYGTAGKEFIGRLIKKYRDFLKCCVLALSRRLLPA